MPFADHFRNASINKGILTAECKKADGKTWVPATINLDDYLGNIDGKFELVAKGNFSQSMDSKPTLTNGVLSAKLKNKTGNPVDAKLDLGALFHSKDGVIARIASKHHNIPTTHPAAATGPTVPTVTITNPNAPPAIITNPDISAFAAGSMGRTVMSAGSVSAASSSATTFSSTSTAHSSISRTSSSSTFSSSKFRYHSQQLLLEDTCSNFLLQGAWLHCDIHHEDGRITRANVDLDLYIGDVDGRLVWDAKGFSKTCTEIHLDGFFLVAKCHNPANHQQFIVARLDLRTRLRIQGSIIIFVETNKKLSMMLSEVPWMKFKVIAEPDLSVFSSHPVVKQTMTRIAESTVEHVTKSMHAMITKAMEVAIVEITASAMQHIATQMEHTVQDAVGYASASASGTKAELLHLGAMGAYGAYGAHGHAHGRHEHHGGVTGNGNGALKGGVWAGWSSSAAHGSMSRTSSSSSSVSSSTHSAASGYTATASLNGR